MFDVIYADPPWRFNNKNTGGSMKSGAEAKYKTMTVDDICSLPVDRISSDNSILFLWWVSSQPKEAIRVAEAWGFKIKTMSGFTWVKVTSKNKRWFGMGFYTRQGTENCLIATKGNPNIKARNIRNLIIAKSYVHSQKPEEARGKIKRLCGDVDRIELFARQTVPGWKSWGYEVTGDLSLLDYCKKVVSLK